MKTGDTYVIPAGTTLRLIELQQSFVTTKKYVAKVTHTMTGSDDAFFCDLYEITFEHYGIPGLLKVPHGETTCTLSMTEPMGDTLEPKILGYRYPHDDAPTCGPECEHLSITEQEQDTQASEDGIKAPHTCRLYGKRLEHGGMHPLIRRLRECEYGDGRQGEKEN